MNNLSNYTIPQISTPPPVTTALGSSSNNEQQVKLQILASLFPPNSPNGSYIAHLKTWEDVPGAPSGVPESKKPRYVLLAVQSDGAVKIHKSKRNTNGTFSIGKTWHLEDLRSLEVHKPRRSNPTGAAMTCFTITINNKSYLWETESSRQQDDFLVTLVRSFRQFTQGSEPRLVGFQVGEIPGAPPAYEVPPVSGGVASLSPTSIPAHIGQPNQRPERNAGRPMPTGNSVISNESSYYAGPSQSLQTPTEPLPLNASAIATSEQRQSPPGPGPSSFDRSKAGPAIQSQPAQPQQSFSTFAEQANTNQGPAGRSGSGSGPSRPALPTPPTPQQRTPTPTRQHAKDMPPPSSINQRKGSIPEVDEAAAAANAAALLNPSSAMLDDSDIMLTNVEEMLEGFEWGAGQSQGADQVEKRLLEELNALEGAGIHAIIESDDRVIDVVKYLDNALAEVDRMDQMLSLYKTHLNAVADDINHIESQNKGLQIQSSNQRALLAELDSILGH